MTQGAGLTTEELLREIERLKKAIGQQQLSYPYQRGQQSSSDLRIEELDAEASLDELPMQQQVLDYTNGDMYEGNTLGSMRHGWGKHTCANGDKYTGNWRLDKRHGRGHAVFARGVHYEGEWADDLADGTGSARYENGGLYEGSFSADVRAGWGTHSFPDGSRYEGEWAGDKMHGRRP